MSLPQRVQSLEHQLGSVNRKLDKMQAMLEEYFGVRRGGLDNQDPILQTYVKLRSYLSAEKTSQQELTSLLAHVQLHKTSDLLQLFKEQLPADEKLLLERLSNQLPTLTNFIRESKLWEELEKARQVLESSSKVEPLKAIIKEDVTMESDAEHPSPTSDTEEELKIQAPQKVLKRKATKAPTDVSQPKVKKPRKTNKASTDTEEIPLESLLRSAGVRFQKAKLGDAKHRLEIAKQLPDRDLSKEQIELIYKGLENISS